MSQNIFRLIRGNLSKFSKANIYLFLQNPLKVFVLIASIFGLIMVFCMPPLMVPDETVHFYRAYQVGEGKIASEKHGDSVGGFVVKVPERDNENSDSVFVLHPGQYFQKTPSSSEELVPFPSSALYNPLPYIPQALGIDVARLIYPSIASMVFMGRIFNLITYIVLVGLAIKIAVRGKWVFAAVGLFPMAIHQAASLSTDVITTGVAFIFISLMYKLFTQDNLITKKQWIAAGLIALCIGLTKQTSLVLLLLPLLLPMRIFSGVKQKIAFVISLVIISLFMAIGWYVLANYYYKGLDMAPLIGLPGVNQTEQLRYIIEHPLSFFSVVFRTYIFEGFKGVQTIDFFWGSTYGYFSWLTYKLPLSFTMLGYLGLFLALLHKEDRKIGKNEIKMLPKTTVVFTMTFIASVIAIAGALYLVWTPVGGAQVSGIQGRYFIPLIPLLIPLFGLIGKWVELRFDKPYRLGIIIMLISTVNLSAMVALTLRWFY